MWKKFEDALAEIRRDSDLKMECQDPTFRQYFRFSDDGGDLFYGGDFGLFQHLIRQSFIALNC